MSKKVMLALLAVFLCVQLGVEGAEAPRLSARIPADAVATVLITDVPAVARGKAWMSDLAQVLDGEAAISLLRIPEKEELPELIILAEVNPGRLEWLLHARLMPILRRNLGKVELETSGGITDIVVNESPMAFCSLQDNLFCFSLDKELLKQMLSEPLAPDRVLQGSPSFAKLLEKVPSPSRSIFVANAAAVLEHFADEIPGELRRPLEGAGFLDISIAGGGTGRKDGSPVASVNLITSGKLQGLLPLYGQPPMPTRSAALVPDDFSGYVRLGFTSFSEGWQILKGAMRGMGGEEGAEGVADFLEQFQQNTGLDFEKDILACLGGELAVAAAVPEKLRIPDAVALLEVKDRDKFEKMLARMLPFPPIGSETYEGVAIHTVQLGPLPAAYALLEDYFIFGTNVSAVKSVVDARRGGASLATNPAFRSAMDALGEGAHVVYLDVGSAMPLLLSAASRFATEQSQRAPGPTSQRWVAVGKLLMSPLLTNAVVAFCVSGDEQSVTSRGYSTITGPYRMYATSGVMAGILLPALMRARESAQRVVCMNNLKQLVTAEKMYAADHRGKFTENLSDLYPTYVNSLNVFLCPSAGEAPITAREDIDLLTSYVLRKGLTEASPSDEVLIYEQPGNHRDGGGNAAFVDGHVEWLDRYELEEIIDEDHAK